MKIPTSTISGGDPALVKQCLDFCQSLASMGQNISSRQIIKEEKAKPLNAEEEPSEEGRVSEEEKSETFRYKIQIPIFF